MWSFIIKRKAQHFIEIHLNTDSFHWDVLITYAYQRTHPKKERKKERKKEKTNS